MTDSSPDIPQPPAPDEEASRRFWHVVYACVLLFFVITVAALYLFTVLFTRTHA